MSSINRSTTNLLRRYVNGAITAPEEAELERRAQTDESLAEAMRGLQSAPEEDHTARVNRMLIAARGQSKAKSVPSRPGRFRWAAAAAVLLLVASSLFFLPSLLDSNTGDLAMTSAPEVKEVEPAPAPTEAEPPPATGAELDAETPPSPSPAPPSSTQDLRPRPENSLKDSPKTSTTSRADEREAVSQKRAIEERKRREVAQQEVQRTPPPPPAFEEEVVEEVMADEVSAAAPEPIRAPAPNVAAGAPVAPASTANSRARSKLKDDLSATSDDAPANYPQAGSVAGNYLEGRITSENGYPIVNALVRLPGLPLGERTDSNGIFQLPADAAATALDISHPDYESERVNLTDPAETLQISLERKEFVADDNDLPRWQQNAASTRIVLDKKEGYASPLEGYSALRQRIEENKPEGVKKGKVKLSFLVNPDGTLTDIQFRGKPSQATMDYIGSTLVSTSVWEVVQGDEPVRVYFKVVFR